MRILITGSKGQLGCELQRCLETMEAEIGPIPIAYKDAFVEAVDYDTLDISNGDAVQKWFAQHGPYNIVFNCAALTNVDGCEEDEEGAYGVNAQGAQNLAQATAECQGKLVHVSTDYVFPGTEERPRNEEDPVNPLSAYGRTKLAGELFVVEACPRSFVVRTAWLYGYEGRNFVKTMLDLARSHGAISVVDDQWGNPTNANDLAYELLKLALTNNYGIYHITNEGTCCWFDLASAATDIAGIPCEKEPLTTEEYKRRFPRSANRPRYSSLENRHLRDTIGNEMRPWREALESYIANLSDREG